MIHYSARIGGRPEHRDWFRDQNLPCFQPIIGQGVHMQPFVTVDAGCKRPTTIGDRCLLLAHVHVGHDCQVGEDCELSTGTILGGHVTVGDRVRLGLGVTVKPGVTIGDDARIGCGAVVVKDVPAGQVWCGNPASELVARVPA